MATIYVDDSVVLSGDGESQATAYKSIQEAIDNAGPDDVIEVAVGTYREQLTIDGKDIEIVGAGQGETIIEAPDAADLQVNAQDPDASRKDKYALVAAINGANLELTGVTIDGRDQGEVPSPPANYDFVGIYGLNSELDVDAAHVTGIRTVLTSGPNAGQPSGVQRTSAVIISNTDGTERTFEMTGSTVENFQKNAFVLDGAGLTVNVTGNTVNGAGGISSTAQNGIQVSSGATGTIADNTISDIAYVPNTWIASSILVYGSNGVSVTGNTINGVEGQPGDAGIVFFDSADSSANNNNLNNLDYALYQQGPVVIPVSHTGNTYSGNLVDFGHYPDNSVPIAVNGESGNDELHGADGSDTFNGAGGDDTLVGDAGDDMLDGGAGVDTLDGGDGNDTLAGGGDNDTLVGGAGDDTLAGGGGDDTYHLEGNDIVTEEVGGGTDTVITSGDYTLGANVENLSLVDASETEDFEDFDVGPIANGENDWRYSGTSDQTVVEHEGSMVFRMSSDPSTGAFGGPYSPDIGVSAGESTTTADGNVHVLKFTFKPVDSTPDNSRLEVDFGNVQGTDRNNFMVIESIEGEGVRIAVSEPLPDGNFDTGGDINDFTAFTGNRTLIEGVDADQWHEIELRLTYNDGADNDVIEVYLNGELIGTTTTFENYRDALGGTHEDNAEVNQTNAIFFRNSASTAPNDGPGGDNKGFYFDDITNTIFTDVNGTGNALDNVITGNSGDNVLSGLAGDDTLIGGAGNDTAVLDGDFADYEITANGSGGYTAEHQATGDTDTISGVEMVRIEGQTVAIGDAVSDGPSIDAVTDPQTGAAIAVAENSSAGTVVATVSASDPDLADFDSEELSYSLEATGGGAYSGPFAIGADGTITVSGGLDFEAAEEHRFQVRVTDTHGNSDVQAVTVDVTDVNEGIGGLAPVEREVQTGSTTPLELQPQTDPDGDTLTYTVAVLPTAGMLLLNGEAVAEGQVLTEAEFTALVYEAPSEAGITSIQFQVSDGENVTSLTVSVETTPAEDQELGSDDAVNGTVTGADGDDTLSGEGDDLTLEGGGGDDTYVVDGDDTVVEDPDGGEDTVQSGGDTELGDNVENLILTGNGNVDGTGNELDNEITGNGGSNTLKGGEGDDALKGGQGTDVLRGGQGGDDINGGVGPDKLNGGSGLDDLDGGVGGDTLNGGQGGDELDGDRGGDTLRGGKGGDDLGGGRGGDTLSGNKGSDEVGGGKGGDTLKGGRGSDELSGGRGADLLEGNKGPDVLRGGKGKDTLDGGNGADTLTGGMGADTFLFRNAGHSEPGNPDVITDFNRSEGDLIDVSGVASFDFVGRAGFTDAAGELRFDQDGGSTFVYGDVDGDGEADITIELSGNVNLRDSDFTL